MAQDDGSTSRLVEFTREIKGVRYIPSLVLIGLRELDLNSVDAVDTVNEEDQDEDKCNFHPVLKFRHDWTFAAVWGVSRCLLIDDDREGWAYMKVNILRRMVNGRGMMSPTKRAISATRSRKTYSNSTISKALHWMGSRVWSATKLIDCEPDSCEDDGIQGVMKVHIPGCNKASC